MTTTLRRKHQIRLEKKIICYHAYIRRHIFNNGHRQDLDTIVDVLSNPQNRRVILNCMEAYGQYAHVKSRYVKQWEHRAYIYELRKNPDISYYRYEDYDSKEKIESTFNYISDRFMCFDRLSYLIAIPSYARKLNQG